MKARVFHYKIIGAICMLMLPFTSCTTDNDNNIDESVTIHLSLGTGSSSKTAKTKTYAEIPTDNGATVGENEGSINTVCVGLFDDDDKTVTIHEYTYTKGESESILTTTQTTKMIVVANVKSGTFSGVTTKADFLSKVQDLSYTTSDDGQSNTNETTAGSQTMTALPMKSSEIALALSSSATTSESVELTRVVARVSISSITTSFDSDGSYAGATFTPTEIFMYNVNDQYAWDSTASASATIVSGESTASSEYAYLGTGDTTTYNTPSSTTPQFFYIFPHTSTSPTKMVIKGTFVPKGGTAETMYYPVIINHAQSNTTFTDADGDTTTNDNDKTIKANKVYNIAVTITGLGVTDPSEDLDPSSVTINAQVQDWTQATQEVSFDDPDIGDYYFSDGTWGTLADHASSTVYPIGVIFSNTTSTNDQARGWTHGYAMALTNAATNYSTSTCIWGPEAEENGETFTDSYGTYTYSYYYNEYYTSFKTNKDGYCETQAIKENHTLSSSSYPAFYYALNYGTSVEDSTTSYAAPSGSSGWFLPSIGQWYDIYENLGKMTSAPTNSYEGQCYWDNDLSGTSTYSYICANNINTYLTAISSYSSNKGYSYGTPDSFSNNAMTYINSSGNTSSYESEPYWSSSEYTSTDAGRVKFYSGGELSFDYNTKDGVYFRVRPVIAF